MCVTDVKQLCVLHVCLYVIGDAITAEFFYLTAFAKQL